MRYIADIKKNGFSIGYLLRGSPKTFDPRGAFAFAHDIMEHGRSDDGSVRDELIAFGAALFVRVEGGFYKRFNANNADRVVPIENIALQIVNDVVPLYDQSYEPIQPIIPSPPIVQPLPNEMEKYVVDIFDHFCIRRPDPFSRSTFHSTIQGWMRYGYWRAKRRYKGKEPETLGNAFYEIYNYFEHCFIKKGDIAIVNLDLSKKRCSMQLIGNDRGRDITRIDL